MAYDILNIESLVANSKVMSRQMVCFFLDHWSLHRHCKIASFWYLTPRYHENGSQCPAAFQLVQQAAEIAEGIGLGRPNSSSSIARSGTGESVVAGDVWRFWIVCYQFSACVGACVRIRIQYPGVRTKKEVFGCWVTGPTALAPIEYYTTSREKGL